MTRKKPPPTTSLAAAEYLTFVAASGGGGVEAVEFEKYRIVQDRLFESDFGRVVVETKRLAKKTKAETPRKARSHRGEK